MTGELIGCTRPIRWFTVDKYLVGRANINHTYKWRSPHSRNGVQENPLLDGVHGRWRCWPWWIITLIVILMLILIMVIVIMIIMNGHLMPSQHLFTIWLNDSESPWKTMNHADRGWFYQQSFFISSWWGGYDSVRMMRLQKYMWYFLINYHPS